MGRIEMTEEIWADLIALRCGRGVAKIGDHPAFGIYGPIAMAQGSFVLAQVGQSLDGRVATPAGDARDISGPDGFVHLHRCRALVDAVMVGVGTVRADDPKLSVRVVAGPDPVRVIVDCRAELTGGEALFHDGGAPVIVLQGRDAPRKSYRGGAEVIRLGLRNGELAPQDMLDVLDERGLRRILVEGGARTIARFVEHGLVDRLHVSVAPIIIGSGPNGISLSPIERLTAAYRPETEVYMLGSDVLFDCRLKREAVSARQGEKVEMANPA